MVLPGAKNLMPGATFSSMERDPSPQSGTTRTPRHDEGASVSDAVERLAKDVDHETWLTLGAAIGQLSAIHDPIPRPD